MKKDQILHAINDLDDDLIAEADPSIKERERSVFYHYRKPVAALCALFLIAVIILPRLNQNQEVSLESGVSPIISYETLQEAEEASGITIALPETIASERQTSYDVQDQTILDISYGDTIRLIIEESDSLMTEEYSDGAWTKEIEIDQKTVTLMGVGEEVRLAEWLDHGLSCSLRTEEGISMDDAVTALRSIH